MGKMIKNVKNFIDQVIYEIVIGWPKDTLNRMIVILELVGIVWMIVSCRQAMKDMNRSLYNWKKPGAKRKRPRMSVQITRKGQE